MPCPTYAPTPTDVDGNYCGPDPSPGNGARPDGVCTGQEFAPPCGPGMIPGTFYEYSLPSGCRMFFDGRPWYFRAAAPCRRDHPTVQELEVAEDLRQVVHGVADPVAQGALHEQGCLVLLGAHLTGREGADAEQSTRPQLLW